MGYRTDSTSLLHKIEVRNGSLPDKEEISVLDAYSSDGLIWSKLIEQNSDKVFKIARLDTRKDRKGFYVETNNERFLEYANLNVYDVIDLDAYGIPFKQLEIVFGSSINTPTTIFVTFNTVALMSLPIKMLELLGFTREMYKVSHTLISREVEEKIFGYLYLRGVREVNKISFTNDSGYHCYLSFTLGD